MLGSLIQPYEFHQMAPRHDDAKTIEICVSPVPARITLGLVQRMIREEPYIILHCALTCL